MTGEIDFALTYPGGFLRSLTIGSTAGDEITNLTPGEGARWIVLYGVILLVTDSTVANRRFNIDLTDGSNITYQYPTNNTAVTASLSRRLAMGPIMNGAGGMTSPRNYHLELDSPIIEGDDQFRITISVGQAGDSYSGIVRVLELGL